MRKLVISNFIITLLILLYLLFNALGINNKFKKVNSFSANFSTDIIKDYLFDNPEVMINSLNNYQKNQIVEQGNKTKKILSQKMNNIVDNVNDPKVGPVNAKIKIIEFFDYSCGYCYKMMQIKQKLLQQYSDIEIIFKETPIMGENSVLKTNASLAFYSVKPDRYLEFQEALFKYSLQNSSATETILKIATSLGANEDSFKKALNDTKKHDSIVKANIQLAMELGLQGTPAYIIGDEIIHGYANYEAISEKIEARRNN